MDNEVAAVGGIDLHVATGRRMRGEKIEPASESPPASVSAREKMTAKLRTGAGQALYKMRKAIVEPMFGQIEQARGIRQFQLRGLAQVQAE